MLNTAAFPKMTYLFKNAHYLAKAGRPYSDFKSLCLLDKSKGIDIGATYSTDKYCQKFIKAIADTERVKQEDIICSSPFISIISDGSTDTSCKEAEIVLLKSSLQCKVISANIVPFSCQYITCNNLKKWLIWKH
ncbi:hypothetical protein DPMN_182731 [Dreissena polymorpha]|uniref:Uncharacterized protein n=1 Tax=Dreissena polymorpha TaxID=45954 RepID=A0A9D4DG20_DREPO|nr:hypothetical protein DPMN_182731 [Dreissena polymorpha]